MTAWIMFISACYWDSNKSCLFQNRDVSWSEGKSVWIWAKSLQNRLKINNSAGILNSWKQEFLQKQENFTSMFKIFHRATCTNQFLHTIGRTNSPLLFCFVFCQKSAKSYIHVLWLWQNLPLLGQFEHFYWQKCGENLDLSTFQKMFDMDLLSSEHNRGD